MCDDAQMPQSLSSASFMPSYPARLPAIMELPLSMLLCQRWQARQAPIYACRLTQPVFGSSCWQRAWSLRRLVGTYRLCRRLRPSGGDWPSLRTPSCSRSAAAAALPAGRGCSPHKRLIVAYTSSKCGLVKQGAACLFCPLNWQYLPSRTCARSGRLVRLEAEAPFCPQRGQGKCQGSVCTLSAQLPADCHL